MHSSQQSHTSQKSKGLYPLTGLSQLILLGESLSKCDHQEDQNAKSLYVLWKAYKACALTALSWIWLQVWTSRVPSYFPVESANLSLCQGSHLVNIQWWSMWSMYCYSRSKYNTINKHVNKMLLTSNMMQPGMEECTYVAKTFIYGIWDTILWKSI